MFGLLWPVQVEKTNPAKDVGNTIKQVFVRLGFPFKCAADEMNMPASNLARGLNDCGVTVSRLAMLPDDVKREIYKALRPFFAMPAIEDADDETIKKLEQQIEDERKARKDLDRRFSDLEEVVRRLVPTHEEAKESARCA
jgi:hypothetical protein